MEYNIVCDRCGYTYLEVFDSCPACSIIVKATKYEERMNNLERQRDEYWQCFEDYYRESIKLRSERDKWKRRALYAKREYHCIRNMYQSLREALRDAVVEMFYL